MGLSCASYFGSGMAMVSLGPSLATLAAHNQTSLAAMGSIFMVTFLGGMASQLVSGPLSDRFGQRHVLVIGQALLALGALGITLSRNLATTLAAGILAGLGQGAFVVALSTLAVMLYAPGSLSVSPAGSPQPGMFGISSGVAAVNLLNVFFGVGAVSGPALAGLCLEWWGTPLPPIWLAAGLLLVLLPFLARIPRVSYPGQHPQAGVSRGISREPLSTPETETSSLGNPLTDNVTRPQPVPPYRSPRLWAGGALLFLYVGTETSLGAWTTSYMQSTATLAAAQAAQVTASFWLALTCGRLFSTLLGVRFTPPRLLTICLAGATLGGWLLVFSPGVLVLTLLAILILGFCFGPIFPTTVATVPALFPHSPATAASLVIALGSLGGMLLPWLQGLVVAGTAPFTGVWMDAVAILVMLAIQISLSGKFRKQT